MARVASSAIVDKLFLKIPTLSLPKGRDPYRNEQLGEHYITPAILTPRYAWVSEIADPVVQLLLANCYLPIASCYLADLNSASTAPCGSAMIENVPTPSILRGGISTFPPSCPAFAVAASVSAT